MAIVYPLKYQTKMTTRTTQGLIAGCWITGLVPASYTLLTMIGKNLSLCTSPYPAQSLFFPAAAAYFVVSLCLLLTYGPILHIAAKQRTKIMSEALVISTVSRASTGIDTSENKKKKKEFKAAHMIGVMIGAFVFLWLPLMITRGLIAFGMSDPVVLAMQDIGAALGTINSSFNWAIYAVTNKEFRRAYQSILTQYKSRN